MGVYTNGVNGNGIVNKIGNTVFYVDADKQQVARVYVADPENPRTEEQQLNRVKTIGSAKLAKNIWRNRDITWIGVKSKGGSYYNTMFSNIRNNPQIDFSFVGPTYGWAFTEYRTADISFVQLPIIVWQGNSGVTKFEFPTASLFVQDPLNPQWSFGFSVHTLEDFYGAKGNDNQILVASIVSLSQGYTQTAEFSLTRAQAKETAGDYLVRYIGITPPEVGNVYAFFVGFADQDAGRGKARNISTMYFCGYLEYQIGNAVFTINSFEFPDLFQ